MLGRELVLIRSIPHLLLQTKWARNTATLTHRGLWKSNSRSITLYRRSKPLTRTTNSTLPPIRPSMKVPSSLRILRASSPSTAPKSIITPYGSLTSICPCTVRSSLCRWGRRRIINPFLRSHFSEASSTMMDRQKNFPQ